jgi:hypothetical protein
MLMIDGRVGSWNQQQEQQQLIHRPVFQQYVTYTPYLRDITLSHQHHRHRHLTTITEEQQPVTAGGATSNLHQPRKSANNNLSNSDTTEFSFKRQRGTLS